jgi:hypothetical protein
LLDPALSVEHTCHLCANKAVNTLSGDSLLYRIKHCFKCLVQCGQKVYSAWKVHAAHFCCWFEALKNVIGAQFFNRFMFSHTRLWKISKIFFLYFFKVVNLSMWKKFADFWRLFWQWRFWGWQKIFLLSVHILKGLYLIYQCLKSHMGL